MSAELEQLKEALPVIREELRKHPPTIGLIGVSGVGKSSTINRLFKTSLATSDTVACTKEFEETEVELAFKEGAVKDSVVQLRVIDAPGLGEEISLDPKYLEMYQKNLGKCDVIVWVMTARNRAVALDQGYLEKLKAFHSNIVFGLNQSDLVEPLDWNIEYNIPSKEQSHNLDIILKDRKEKLSSIVGREVKLVEYSSKTGYRLEELFATIIDSCPEERAWIFNSLKGFSYKDYTPKVVLDALKKRERESSSKNTFLDNLNPFK